MLISQNIFSLHKPSKTTLSEWFHRETAKLWIWIWATVRKYRSMWRNSKRCNRQFDSPSTVTLIMITNISYINLFTYSFTLSSVGVCFPEILLVFLEWLRNKPVSYLNMHKTLIFCTRLLWVTLVSHHRRHQSESLLFSWIDESYKAHQIIDVTSSMNTIKESIRIIPFNKSTCHSRKSHVNNSIFCRNSCVSFALLITVIFVTYLQRWVQCNFRLLIYFTSDHQCSTRVSLSFPSLWFAWFYSPDLV